MKTIQLLAISFGLFTATAHAQWQLCAGTEGLNMQSLLTMGTHNFAGGQTGAYLSTDGAATYALSNTGNDAVGPTRGFAYDNNFVYTCTSQGLYRSADQGANWTSVSNGLGNLLTSGISHADPYIVVATPTGVFRSIDQGDNWTAAGLSATDVRCITAIADTLFAGTNGSGIYKSTDWGANWVAVNNGLSSTNFRAIQSQGSLLFAGGQTGTGVFRSTDLGANWSLLGGGLSAGSYRGFASNDQIVVAGSFGGGVFYSLDNGDTWTAINAGLTDLTIFDLELTDTDIIAATNTQGVFRYSLSQLSLSVAESVDPSSAQLFPNPAIEEVTVLVDQPLVGSSYALFDLLGKAVAQGRISGERMNVELSALPDGVYTLRIAGTKAPTLRFIKHSH